MRTVRLDRSGDRRANADAIAAALAGQPPSIVIDFCWGPAAEATFEVLRRDDFDIDGADIRYVEVGTAAGPDAALPSALLCSRAVTIGGGSLGGTPVSEIVEHLPQFAAMIADGRVHVPYTAYPLSRIEQAWAADDGTRAVVVPG